MAFDIVDHHAVDLGAIGVHIDIDQAGQKAHLDTGIARELIQNELQALGPERRPAVIGDAPEFRRHLRAQKAALVHGFNDFPHDAADQPLDTVGHGIEGGHQTRCAHAPHGAGALHQKRLGAQPGRRNRRRRTAGPAAGDHQIVFLIDRDFPGKTKRRHYFLLLNILNLIAQRTRVQLMQRRARRGRRMICGARS
jgi:hypothetical protein